MDAPASPSTTVDLLGPDAVGFESTYADALPELVQAWQADVAPQPALLVLNEELAAELGLDADLLRTVQGLGVLLGTDLPAGTRPVAMAYAGHQFGGFSPRLGDGRALLLGEVVGPDGSRRDLHLKGSGRTNFARGGDGKAAIGPMLREYLVSEAMHALGIPTTRSLAVVATGEPVMRERGPIPGAVLARVASSHIRVGTFEYAALLDQRSGHDDVVRRLADHAIARHHPTAVQADDPYLAFLELVVEAQASLIARWMLVGFVHGVMNTDNTTISGETIDYGPCAFMEAYDPATVFSSIDHGGRYALANQPRIVQWNLARFAETLLPLISADVDVAVERATEVLTGFGPRFEQHWRAGLRQKVGLADASADPVADGWLDLLQAHRVDWTSGFRQLAQAVRGERIGVDILVGDHAAVDAWWATYEPHLPADAGQREAIADDMDRVNPLYIPRNHILDEALDAATAGDLGPFAALLAVVQAPFTEQPGKERFALPAPPEAGPFRTFCGT